MSSHALPMLLMKMKCVWKPQSMGTSNTKFILMCTPSPENGLMLCNNSVITHVSSAGALPSLSLSQDKNYPNSYISVKVVKKTEQKLKTK
jgi:hypothetical protein